MILNFLVIALISSILFFFHGEVPHSVINGVSIGFILLGLLLFFATTVGLLRFPDFYTRMHAAGKGDTLSSILILAGIAIYTLGQGHMSLELFLVGVKILVIVNFIFIGSPTATHAIMDAGYTIEIEQWDSKGKSS